MDMRPEIIAEIDRIYFCTQCRTVFLFKTESEEHKDASGHTEILYEMLD
jgi:hypothetical protein